MNALSKIETLTAENFDAVVQHAEQPVVVDFWAPWCGPCQAFGPVIEAFAEEQGEAAVVAKVNVDDAPDLAARYGIRSIPTVLVFRNGEVVSQSSGVASKAELAARVRAAAG